MKKGLLFLTVVCALNFARAEVVLDEPFDYDDGAIIELAADTWKTHSGTGGQTEVSDGRLMMTQSNS